MKRAHIVGVRVTSEERDALAFAARIRGTTVAGLLRSAALREARLLLRLASERDLDLRHEPPASGELVHSDAQPPLKHEGRPGRAASVEEEHRNAAGAPSPT